jgi:hypothetical protein
LGNNEALNRALLSLPYGKKMIVFPWFWSTPFPDILHVPKMGIHLTIRVCVSCHAPSSWNKPTKKPTVIIFILCLPCDSVWIVEV